MDQPVSLSDLISTEAIPVNAGWSSVQAELAARLSRTIGDLASDADLFVQRALTVLVMRGDCRGLAFPTDAADTGTDTDKNLFCRFLKCEVLHSAATKPSLVDRVPIGLMAIERIARSLSLLHGEDGWEALFARPHPIRNRLIHYQLAISSSPAYSLVAAALHHGICAKIEQLIPQAEGSFDARLGGFTNWTIQIVCAIPQSVVRDSLADYQPGEFNRIIKGVIQHIQDSRVQKGGRGAYRPASLQTLWHDWQAIFHGTARENPFRDRPNYSVRLARQFQDAAEPERMPTDQSERRQFLESGHHLDMLERRELDANRAISPKRAAVRPRAESLDSAHACLAANPSTSMPGVLPRVILAMVYDGLDRLHSNWHEPNIACARLLVMFMLHLGRRPEWLLKLRVGSRPGCPENCAEPVYDRSERSIYYLPARYLGLPSLLAPRSGMSLADQAEYKRAWQDHDLVFEKINLIHEIVLPGPLVDAADNYIGIRHTIISKQPLMVAGSGVQDGNGPLFLWMRAGVLSLADEQAVSDLLSSLTYFVRQYVPDYPALKPSNFIRSFDAYYAGFGMRGEFRYSVSERERYWLEMPLRYSLIGSDQVHSVHSPACNRLENEIYNERARVNLSDATAHA